MVQLMLKTPLESSGISFFEREKKFAYFGQQKFNLLPCENSYCKRISLRIKH